MMQQDLKRIAKKSPRLVYLTRKIRKQPPQTLAEIKAELNPEFKPKTDIPIEYDMNFYANIEERLAKIPESNGGRYYQKYCHKLALICDVFLCKLYKDVANTVVLHPDTWQEQLNGVTLLIVAPVWRGLAGEWTNVSIANSKNAKLVLQIITYARQNGIKTAFYGKDDPPDYPRFLHVAKQCEYIFTTDENSVLRYKTDCQHERVFPLMFGVNPLYHNPVGAFNAEKLPHVIFSGSWMDKFPERSRDICTLFDGVLASNRPLKIIDRNMHENAEEFRFPERYSKFVSPPIAHETLQKVHKLYDIAININTVKSSPTMFANRIVELQASGNVLISNESLGVNLHFPEVFTADNAGEITKIINNLTAEQIHERKIRAIRQIMTGNTCFDRYAEILEKMGLPTIDQQRKIAIVGNSPKCNIAEEELAENYEKYDIIAFMDDREYNPFYLEDMCNVFKFTACDYVTFVENDENLKEIHNYTEICTGKQTSVFWRAAFSLEKLINIKNGDVLPNGYRI
ncbi:MAG: hypothetical protein FWG65_07175 [Turicibacter sp.]|nr:hypothetical protein [Turicibacter sp.]